MPHLGAVCPVGPFHTWWRGDPLSVLPPLAGLTIAPADDEHGLSALAGIDAEEFRIRGESGHRPWMARMTGEPVAWGWCASHAFTIGELGISRSLPEGNCYLWDFLTLSAWRGRGIYPRLLQAIVANEPDVERFWVGHDHGNTASARGIAKTGFQEVGQLYLMDDGGYTLFPSGPLDRAAAASSLFGVCLTGHRGEIGLGAELLQSDHRRVQTVR